MLPQIKVHYWCLNKQNNGTKEKGQSELKFNKQFDYNQVAILTELENGELHNKGHLNNWLHIWKNEIINLSYNIILNKKH